MKLREHLQLNELFEKLPDIDINWGHSGEIATVSIGDTGTQINMNFSKYSKNSYRSDFSMKERGKANPMEVFMGAAKAIGEFIKRKKPDELAFIPFDINKKYIKRC